MKDLLSQMASENNESSNEPTNMQIHILVLKAEEMCSKENIDEAMIYLNEAKKMNSKLGDQQLEALILEQFCLCYLQSEHFEKAMKKANEAIEIFRQLPGQTGRAGNANGLLNLATIHVKLGKHKEAIQYQEQATEILLKLRKEGPDLKLPMLENMDEIPPAMKDMIHKMKSYKELVRLSDEKSLALAYGNNGETCVELGEFEKGLELCQEALKINRNIGDKLAEARDLHNIGHAYYFLGEVRKCIQYCQESKRIFTEIGNKNDASMSVGVLAMAYEALGDVENSKRYYQMCIETFLAKITIFYCYFKTILLLSHLFLCYFMWKKPYFNPIIIFYQNRESYFIHVLFYFIPIFLDNINKIAYFNTIF